MKEMEEKYEAANQERKRLERSLHKKEAEMEQRVTVSIWPALLDDKIIKDPEILREGTVDTLVLKPLHNIGMTEKQKCSQIYTQLV